MTSNQRTTTMKPRVTIDGLPITVGKSMTVKREKGDDKTESNVAHMAFTGLFLQREQIDSLLARASGWAHSCFYTAAGDVAVPLSIGVPLLNVTVSGVIRGADDAVLPLKQAVLSAVVIDLCRLGALMSGKLSWLAEGDEVSDVDELLGRLCLASMEIHDGAQGELLDNKTALEAEIERIPETTHDKASQPGDDR